MRIFKNKFFLICLCIALVLSAVPTTLSVMGYRSLSRDIVGTLTTPFRFVGNWFTNAVEGFSLYFRGVNTLYRENAALREENASLKAENDRAELLEAENARLREYLSMKERYPTLALQDGMIVSREAGNYLTLFTLDCGSLSGIEVGMPVIAPYGVVGSVCEVGLTWCRVTSLLDTGNSVGVVIPRSGATGVLEGTHTLGEDGLCRITYLAADADIAVGDIVTTSGMGSVYPAGLTVGEVVAVESDAYNRTLIATVKPTVDLSDLTWVMVVMGK